ncbi:MAG: metallophosphoesterase [Sedimentisphaerales bacterium]|nr:metallophosphoesterase [Sedimentisphaerales bacterium]
MTIKMAVLTDLHASAQAVGDRRGDWAEVLLLRAVHRINRWIKPDVTLVLGDLINDTQVDVARYGGMRETLELLDSPVIILPGNHDVAPDSFYKYMPGGDVTEDIAGCRFVSFLDEQTPGFNARRSVEDIARLRDARQGWNGPIVALQHVPLIPPDSGEIPYSYDNAEEVVAAMKHAGVNLTISGHYHEGWDLFERDGIWYLVAPGLCESPFTFLEVLLDGSDVRVNRHDLRLPEQYRLVDRHIHTQLAYCSENITVERTAELAELFGLAGFALAEHSDQLYCAQDTWNKKQYLYDGFDAVNPQESRVEQYFSLAKNAGIPRQSIGLEAESTYKEPLLVRDQDRARCGFLIGAVHQLRELKKQQTPSVERAIDDFLSQTQQVINAGVDILAHPFRIFRRRGLERPESIYEPVVKMLRDASVAAELNFHTNDPPIEFVRLCLAAGVKLAFGSDAHNMYEVGEFWPQIQLLRQAGYNGDFSDILWQGPSDR